MSTHRWLRIRTLSAATPPTGHRRDRRHRPSAFGFGPPRPEGLEDRTLLANSPIVTTQAATSLAATSATLNGTVNPNGTTAAAAFEYATNQYLAPDIATTFAGTAGTSGSTDGTGAAARFSSPENAAVDPTTGDIFVADTANDTIRMITPAGVVTTLAGTAGTTGSTDGTGAAALFNHPTGVAVDPATGNIYVADTGNDTIRQVTSAGVVTTLAGTAGTPGSADGTGAAATFNGPTGITFDSSTSDIYVGDTGNDTIRQIATGGVVTTLAGTAGTSGSADGTGAAARFSAPTGLAVDPTSGSLFVADTGNDTIRQIATGGVVTTLAGTAGTSGSTDGTGAAARFNSPRGVTVDPTSGSLFVADTGNDTVRQIAPGGVVSTLAGTAGTTGSTDGTGAAAHFNSPFGVAMNPATGALYVADTGNDTIRQLSLLQVAAQSGLTGTTDQPVNAAITGLTPSTTYYFRAVATDSSGGGPVNGSILSFTTPAPPVPTATTQAATSVTSTSATLNGTVNPNGTTAAAAFEYATNPYLAPNVATTLAGTAGTTGSTDGTGAAASFSNPQAVAVDSTNGDIFVADTTNDTIRMITPAGVVTTLAGTAGTAGSTDGTGAAALFNHPTGVAVDSATGNIYVADTGNDTIRMITPAGVVTTLAGTAGTAGSTDGTGAAARFSGPQGITVDPTNGNIYVADTGNDTIRMIATGGVVTTLAGTAGSTGSTDGTGSAARFSGPKGVTVDPTTHDVYVADTGNDTIRTITSAGVVTTLAGTAGSTGSTDGTGSAASFNGPKGVTVDPTTGFVFVADSGNDTIRLITPGGVVTTLAGTAGTTGSTDGTGSAASFKNPTGLAFDSTNDTIFVADAGNNTIRQLSLPQVAAQSGLTGTTDQPVNAAITGLTPSTTYYFRAVATDSSGGGPVNGSILSFTTSSAVVAPTATTQGATSITGTTATLNGVVNPQGGATSAQFVYGTDSTLTTNTTSVPIPGLSIGSGTADVPVIEPLSGLKPSTTYYFRIVAINSAGTTNGNILSFTTTAQTVTTPTITTGAATTVTSTGATLNATVNPNGVATTVHFVYGTTTTLSSGTTTTADQSIGSGTTAVPVTAALTGLKPGTTYYYEAVATSNGVATLGPIQSLTTAAAAAGPRITNLQRFGYHTQPTEFVLTFDSALNPTSAQDVRNYTIVSMSGSNSGSTIPIASAVYNATNHTVTLKTVDRVYLYGQYQITVNGTSPSGVSNASGQFLAGQNGKAGTNYVQSFGEEILAGPDLSASMSQAKRTRIMKAWPHNRAYATRVTAHSAAKARHKAEVQKVHHAGAAVRVHPAGIATANAAARTDTHAAAVDAAITELAASEKPHRHGRG